MPPPRPLAAPLTKPSPQTPPAIQQRLLDTFTTAFSDLLSSSTLLDSIQRIKGHLYAREFDSAFGEEELREAYAARWSAGRALGYAELALQWEELAEVLRGGRREQEGKESDQGDKVCVACLGGGAGAEVVGFTGAAGWLRKANGLKGGDWMKGAETCGGGDTSKVMLQVVDVADWASVLAELRETVTRSPVAQSTGSTASHVPLLNSSDFEVAFQQQDLLLMESAALKRLVHGCALVTLMFTLNELYTTSLPRTTALLLSLTDALRTGTLLLVVDSPGSYSTVKLGKGGEKRYPMQWLLNHTLLQAAKIDARDRWRKIRGEDSKWFRRSKGLEYAVDLEDMRYQAHLYERL